MPAPAAEFQKLLRELFQFDRADLDFGVYRIMNHKRDAVERFIAETLPRAISRELQTGALDEAARAGQTLADAQDALKTALGDSALDPDGNLNPAYAETPLGKAYLDAQAAAGDAPGLQSAETGVYNHLYAFFRRYYQDGDFISKRRYSRAARYAIPYNGEEVYLHWANSDQYYVKTAERFQNYDWRAPNGVSVRFRIRNANVENGNVKGDKRFFVPQAESAEWSESQRAITVPFEYRPLTAAETRRYGARSQQDKIIAAAAASIPAALIANNAPPDALSALTGKGSAAPNANGEPATALESHLKRYARRNEADFFIHKDLAAFLNRELDFYIKNEILNLDNLIAAGERAGAGWFQITRLVKKIGGKIIAFLAQIEDFQKTLWEKRKFVTDVQYCVTLGAIADPSLRAEIIANNAQWTEWRELLGIDPADRSIAFLQANPTLTVDTAHFGADFADRLLASFTDLDGMTDGVLIHGDNWQALRLMEESYRGAVKCIYIDPPYNTGDSEILYKNGYKHSSWISLMENRIGLSSSLMNDSSVLTVAIDENEQEHLGFLLSQLFPLHAKTCVAIVHNPGGVQGDNFSYSNEFAYFVYPPKGQSIGKHNRPDNPDVRPLRDVSTGQHLRTDAANCFYPIYVRDGEIIGFGDVCDDDFHPSGVNVDCGDGTIAVYPIDANGNERKWVFSRQNVETIRGELAARINRSRKIWDIIREKTVFNYKTVWNDKLYNANAYGTKLLRDIIGSNLFSFPKSVHTVTDCVRLSTNGVDNATVLDYFAGSGTTAHAVINLNREDGGRRRFVLVEMGEYFDTVLLPRVKKIVFSPEWRNGSPKRAASPEEAERAPRIVKRIRIESYEDALDGIEFDPQPAGNQMPLEDTLGGEYVLKYMLKWETRGSRTMLNIAELTRPFDYALRRHANGEKGETPADLAETFNWLIGMKARTRKVYADGESGRRYLVYDGETRAAPGRRTVIIWRDTDGWDESAYARDRDFVAEQGMADGADAVYANGGSAIPDSRAVETLFAERMFAGADGANGGF